jgi:hypothetical protein
LPGDDEGACSHRGTGCRLSSGCQSSLRIVVMRAASYLPISLQYRYGLMAL